MTIFKLKHKYLISNLNNFLHCTREMQNFLVMSRKIFICSSHAATIFLKSPLYNRHGIIDLKGDYMYKNKKATIDKEWLSLMQTAKNMNLTKEEIREFIRKNANKTKQKKNKKGEETL